MYCSFPTRLLEPLAGHIPWLAWGTYYQMLRKLANDPYVLLLPKLVLELEGAQLLLFTGLPTKTILGKHSFRCCGLLETLPSWARVQILAPSYINASSTSDVPSLSSALKRTAGILVIGNLHGQATDHWHSVFSKTSGLPVSRVVGYSLHKEGPRLLRTSALLLVALGTFLDLTYLVCYQAMRLGHRLRSQPLHAPVVVRRSTDDCTIIMRMRVLIIIEPRLAGFS